LINGSRACLSCEPSSHCEDDRILQSYNPNVLLRSDENIPRNGKISERAKTPKQNDPEKGRNRPPPSMRGRKDRRRWAQKLKAKYYENPDLISPEELDYLRTYLSTEGETLQEPEEFNASINYILTGGLHCLGSNEDENLESIKAELPDSNLFEKEFEPIQTALLDAETISLTRMDLQVDNNQVILDKFDLINTIFEIYSLITVPEAVLLFKRRILRLTDQEVDLELLVLKMLYARAYYTIGPNGLLQTACGFHENTEDFFSEVMEDVSTFHSSSLTNWQGCSKFLKPEFQNQILSDMSLTSMNVLINRIEDRTCDPSPLDGVGDVLQDSTSSFSMMEEITSLAHIKLLIVILFYTKLSRSEIVQLFIKWKATRFK